MKILSALARFIPKIKKLTFSVFYQLNISANAFCF